MSTYHRLALSALGKAPVWFALVMGTAVPATTALALWVPVSEGTLSPVMMLAIQGLVALLVLASTLPLWRREASFDGHRLQVKAAFYTRRSPLAEFRLDQAQVVNLSLDPTLKPMLKTNGYALPGFWAGHFRLRDRRKAFCLVTDPTKVLALPHSDGRVWLLGLEHPQAVLDILRRGAG
ncbi:MAG: hypothetical protein KA187_02760 [Arenimonas sp.]|nr:hypothetical protein [Arenimonas sp.]MBP6626317.1 hypothetical protein [Arenimonas sp.]